jgi:arginase family enzyme
VTVSYGAGTFAGPAAILKASAQVDLFDPDVADAWRVGLAMDDIPVAIKQLNDTQGSMTRLVQVGIRDFCEDEANLIRESNNRVISFFDHDIKSPCGADEWDANVGARLLYRMANLAAASNAGRSV